MRATAARPQLLNFRLRRFAGLPAIAVETGQGQSSPVEIARSGILFPPMPSNMNEALQQPGAEFIQSETIRVVGRAAGRDTIEIRTRFRALRLPVVVEP